MLRLLTIIITHKKKEDSPDPVAQCKVGYASG